MVSSGSRSWAAVRAHGRFTANVLASDQRQLSQALAGWSPDKFRDVTFAPSGPDALVIHRCLAWTHCRIDREIDAGDHTIVLAEPLQMTVARPSAHPLVHHQRSYHRTLQVEGPRAPAWS